MHNPYISQKSKSILKEKELQRRNESPDAIPEENEEQAHVNLNTFDRLSQPKVATAATKQTFRTQEEKDEPTYRPQISSASKNIKRDLNVVDMLVMDAHRRQHKKATCDHVKARM